MVEGGRSRATLPSSWQLVAEQANTDREICEGLGIALKATSLCPTLTHSEVCFTNSPGSSSANQVDNSFNCHT